MAGVVRALPDRFDEDEIVQSRRVELVSDNPISDNPTLAEDAESDPMPEVRYAKVRHAAVCREETEWESARQR